MQFDDFDFGADRLLNLYAGRERREASFHRAPVSTEADIRPD